VYCIWSGIKNEKKLKQEIDKYSNTESSQESLKADPVDSVQLLAYIKTRGRKRFVGGDFEIWTRQNESRFPVKMRGNVRNQTRHSGGKNVSFAHTARQFTMSKLHCNHLDYFTNWLTWHYMDEHDTRDQRQGKTRKPRKGAAVIAASMHGFASCRKFKSLVTLTLDRVKVISTYTVHVGLPAGPTMWL